MPRQATEVWAQEFEDDFRKLPDQIQERVLAKIWEMGRRLDSFPHERLQGCAEFRIRVGEYRAIYSFDMAQNILWLHVIGHRREVYR
jgi:mRNA interferase RelE/StbE